MPASRLYSMSTVGGGGAPNPDAEEAHTYPFAYNTPSPATVFQIPAGARIISTRIAITEPFDDPLSTIKLGDAGLVDRLMLSSENEPTVIGNNESNIPYTYAAATNILLTINPAASVQGAGYVVVIFNLNA